MQTFLLHDRHAIKSSFRFSYVLHFELFDAACLRKSLSSARKFPMLWASVLNFTLNLETMYLALCCLRTGSNIWVLLCASIFALRVCGKIYFSLHALVKQSLVALLCFCFARTPVANRARIRKAFVSHKLPHARLCYCYPLALPQVQCVWKCYCVTVFHWCYC